MPAKKKVSTKKKSSSAPKKKVAPSKKKASPKKKAAKPAVSKATESVAKELSARERVFCDQVVTPGINPEQAALKAGYAETTARCKAWNWVSKSRDDCPANKLHVWDEVARLRAEISEETQIDAKWLLERLAAEATADISDIYFDDGALKPMKDWPEIWRTGLVAGVEVHEQFLSLGQGEKIPDGSLVKIKLSDRLKRLELIGKHVDVQAFITKVEVNDVTDRAARLQRARQNAANG